MSIQFQRQFLMGDEGAEKQERMEHIAAMLVRHCNADTETASILAKVAVNGGMTDEEAVDLCKKTIGINEEGGSMATAAGPTLEKVRVKRQQESRSPYETGLAVAGVSQLDNEKIGDFVDEDDLYAEPRKGYWFFFEEIETYGALKKLLIQKFKERGINVDFATFQIGEQVTYLGSPGTITGIQKDVMGGWNYSVLYDKGTGKTKATNIYNKGGEIEPLKEDAPILAGGKIKDNYAVSHFGYKEAPRGHAKLKGIIVKDLWNEEALNENYHRFKKETATRTKAQQMHEAAKAIEKRLHEVNKLLEYTNELKSELFEGGDESQMTHHTKKVFEKVTRNIAEAYSKLKKIK